MANAEAMAGLMTVEVAWSATPRQTDHATVQLPPGSTALDALRASGVAVHLGAAVLDTLTLALWGRAITPATVLQPHDRLEDVTLQAMADALRRCHGNVSAAAKWLGVSRNTIYRKKAQLPPDVWD